MRSKKSLDEHLMQQPFFDRDYSKRICFEGTFVINNILRLNYLIISKRLPNE